MTSLARIIVSVSDLNRSLALYEDVLGLHRRYAQGEIAMLATDEPAVEVMLRERPPTPGDAGVAPSFLVDDVDAVTAAAIAAGATIVDEPSEQPWGERQAVLHDPDGHLFCLVQPTV